MVGPRGVVFLWVRYPCRPTVGSVGSWGGGVKYRGTSLTRNSALVGPYSRSMHRALW